jgi:hypothetical protein
MIHGVDRRRSNSDVLWNYELLQLIEGKSTVEHLSFSSEPMLEYKCQHFIKRRVLLNLFSSKVYQNKLTEATVIIRNPNRVLGIVTRLQAGRSGFRIPIAARDFSPLQNVQTGSEAHPASCLRSTGVLPREIKRSGHKINLSLPLVPRLRISGATPLLPPLCLHGRDRRKIYLFLDYYIYTADMLLTSVRYTFLPFWSIQNSFWQPRCLHSIAVWYTMIYYEISLEESGLRSSRISRK